MADTSLQRLLADARVDAKVQKDMAERTRAEVDKVLVELTRVKGALTREEALRKSAERQVVERESELRDYQSKLDHDRKKVESANASRKTDQAKMEYAAAEVRVEADKVEQRLEEQLRSLRRQLAEAQTEAAVDFDIKRSEVADETAKQWEAKMAKAIAATEKKEAVRYTMLKEDYDEMSTQTSELQKQMRQRVREVEQNSIMNGAEGKKAVDDLKLKSVEVKRFTENNTRLQVELSASQAALDTATSRSKIRLQEIEDELREKLSELQERQIDLAATRVDLKTTKKKLKSNKEKLSTAKKERDEIQLERDETVNNLTAAKTTAEHELAAIRGRATSLEAELDDERKLRREVEAALSTRTNELREGETNLAETQRHLDKTIAKTEQLAEENSGLTKQLQASSESVIDLTTQIERTVAEMRSACFQNESVVTQLSSLQSSLAAIVGGEAALALVGSPTPKPVAGDGADDDDEFDDDAAEGFGSAASKQPKATEGAAAVASTIELFRKRLTEVQQITSNLTSSGSAAATKNADRVLALEELTARNAGLGVMKKELQTEVDTLSSDLKTVRAELETLTTDHTTKVKECTDLQAQSGDLVGQVGTRTGEIEVQRKLVDSLNERLGKTEGELQNARCDIEGLTARLKEKTVAYDAAMVETNKSHAEMEEVEKQLEMIGSTAASAVEKLKAAREELTTTKVTLAATKEELDDLTATFEVLQAEHVTAKAEVERLVSVEADLTESQQFVRQLTEELNESEDKTETLVAELATARDDGARTSAMADSKDKMMVANTESMMSTEKRFAEQSVKVDSLLLQTETQGTQLAEVTATAAALERTNAELASALEERKLQVDKAMDELATSARTEAEIKQQIRDTETKMNVEQQVGGKLTALLGETESKLIAANTKADTLELTKADLEKDVATLTRRTAELEGAIDELDAVKTKLAEAETTVTATRTGRNNVATELQDLKAEHTKVQQRLAAAERLVSNISVEKLRAVTESRALAQKLEQAIAEQNRMASALGETRARLGTAAEAAGVPS